MRQLFILSFLLLSFFTEDLLGQVRLTGDIRALGDADLIIEYFEGNVQKSNTVKVIDGKFDWSAPITEVQKITMIFPGRAVWVFVEPGRMKMTGTRDSIDNLKITGSVTNDEAIAYAKTIRILEESEKALYQQHNQLSPEEEMVKETKLSLIADQKKALIYDYITQHNTSALSLNLVTEYSRLGVYEDVSRMYDTLSPIMKSTWEGKRLASRLEILNHSAIGQKMIAFTTKNEKGAPITSSDFKGKYILIDFWASWCAPCRKEIPGLIEAYRHFSTKNFTIVSVSLDDNKESWLRAISRYNMPWTQVSDLNGWNNELCVYFGIQGIPSTLLIDPKGVIIAKNLMGMQLKKKLEVLLNQD